MAVTLAMLTAGFALKQRCFGPQFDVHGVSGPDLYTRWTRDVCYTDIQALWGGRSMWLHLVPYLHGGMSADGTLEPGTLEYPVLSGLAVWALGLGAHTDRGLFVASVLALGASALVTAWLLARAVGWRALIWAAAPALVLYSFLNWDHLVVAVCVGALACAARAERTSRPGWAVASAALIAAGGALKFYPLMFALPIALMLATRGTPPAVLPERRVVGLRRWTLAWLRVPGLHLGPAVGFVAVVLAVTAGLNLPFALANAHGWWAAYAFQWSRPIDASTNSVWYYALRVFDHWGLPAQPLAALGATLSTGVGLVAVTAVGWWRRAREGAFPWLATCGAMLAVYLVANKVHSPQYLLWFIPFLVLLRVPWGLVVGYYAVDVCLGIGFLRALDPTATEQARRAAQIAQHVGALGRAALLLVLIVVLVRSEPVGRWRSRSVRRGDESEGAQPHVIAGR